MLLPCALLDALLLLRVPRLLILRVLLLLLLNVLLLLLLLGMLLLLNMLLIFFPSIQPFTIRNGTIFFYICRIRLDLLIIICFLWLA